MKLTIQETALITNIRGLCFEDLLDATEGILNISAQAATSSRLKKITGDIHNEAGFMVRSKNLEVLAELLGDANADFRFHVCPPEIIGTGVTQMIPCEFGEAIHLFKMMQKYGTTCSLELNAEKTLDPLLGATYSAIKVDVMDKSENSDAKVILELDSSEFGFDLKNHSFSKYVSDCQITILVTENVGNYAAWFHSGVIGPEGIEEANSYEEVNETAYAIDINGSDVTETFNKIAEKLRSGWKISGISDSTGNDGHLYIDLVLPENGTV